VYYKTLWTLQVKTVCKFTEYLVWIYYTMGMFAQHDDSVYTKHDCSRVYMMFIQYDFNLYTIMVKVCIQYDDNLCTIRCQCVYNKITMCTQQDDSVYIIQWPSVYSTMTLYTKYGDSVYTI